MHSMTIRFRSIAAAAVLAAGLMMAQPQAAIAAESSNFATINIEAILRDSAAAKSTKDQIDAKRSQFQNELKKVEDKLHKDEQALKEQKTLLAEDALQAKQKEFMKQVGDARKELEVKRERLNAAYAQALGDIQQSVNKIVQKLATERGYQMVIPTANLLYAVPSLDITQEVLAQLDKDLPTVKLDFNAPVKAEKDKE